MARPIEFDREEVLQHAMNVFWHQGYNATSIKDLVEATNLQPGSIYCTFNSKHALFLEAIEAYFNNAREHTRTILHTTQPPLDRIRQFFDHIIKDCVNDRKAKGCFLINTLLEIPNDDMEIHGRINGMIQEYEGEFKKVLEEAQREGTLAVDKDSAALATLLVIGIHGLRVYNKTRPKRSALKVAVDNLLSVLE